MGGGTSNAPGDGHDILTRIERAHDADGYELARVLSAAVYVPDPAPRRSWWRRLISR